MVYLNTFATIMTEALVKIVSESSAPYETGMPYPNTTHPLPSYSWEVQALYISGDQTSACHSQHQTTMALI